MQLWVIGGGGDVASRRTEWVNLNGATQGSELPEPGWISHCAAQLSPGNYIIIGGANSPKKTMITSFDPNDLTKAKKMNLEWTDGPFLNGLGRLDHACAHIKHKNVNYVVVVGGRLPNGEPGEYLATSEILNADDISKGWYPGKRHKSICVKLNLDFGFGRQP